MSKSRVVLSILLVLICIGTALSQTAALRVNEANVRTKLEANVVRVTIPVITQVPGEAVIKLSLLDPSDKKVVTADATSNLKAGINSIPFSLVYNAGADNDLLWYRLRYSISDKQSGRSLSDGIVSVGATVRDCFELRMIHQKKVAEGTTYDVRIQAFNPVTMAPVPGVQIKGTLTFGDQDDKDLRLVRVTTGSSGEGLLSFKVPSKVEGYEGRVNVSALKAGNLREDYFDVELNHAGRIIITTDKMLYQPGQSFHARALVLDTTQRAIAGTEIKFELRDEENAIVFSSQAKTNNFGIANTDWELPESLRLGQYTLSTEVPESERYAELAARTGVRVSRYDLPEFTVTIKPDKSYYLPGQNAQVDVSGIYLFGKPVTRGSVRLVEEEERHWNYKEQKWEVEEEAEQKAVLDATGHAKFTIDLSKKHADFEASNYRRYRDFSYAAYITDQTTGKTEQRRLNLRISADPIHVYVSGMNVVGKEVSFYVTTSYPDGTPASCTVNINEVFEDYETPGSQSTSIPLTSVKTNKYGVGKVLNLRLNEDERADSTERRLALQVHDKNGAFSRYEEMVWMRSDHTRMQVTTDKALYAKDDPILVYVRSDPTPAPIVISALVKGAAVWSATVKLHHGRATLMVPYMPAFRDKVMITALAMTDDVSESSLPFALRTVLYPHNNELTVSIKTDANSYKPGDPVSASLHVTSADGTSDASALGIVVVDKAVEERARTDQDFGSANYGFWDWSWWYGNSSVAGISVQDLEKIDMSRPLPGGMDLVAELLLTDYWDCYYYVDRPEIESPATYASTANRLYRERFMRESVPIRTAFLDDSLPEWTFPTNQSEAMRVLSAAKMDIDSLRDPWNTPLKFAFDLDYQNRIVRIISAGPDKTFGTNDDFTDDVRWNYFSTTGKVIDRAIKEHYARTTSVIHDYDSLRAELLRSGVDLNGVRDPWGHAYVYKFGVYGKVATIEVISHGPNAPKQKWMGDTTIWTGNVDYFRVVRDRLDQALQAYNKLTGRIPDDEADFDKALASAGVMNFHEMRDLWGKPYRTAYLRNQRYGDVVHIQLTKQETTRDQKPVTQTLRWFLIVSNGPDGKPDTADDVTLATYSQVVAEQSASDVEPKLVTGPSLRGTNGAIEGIVTDPTGAVIPGATVTAEEENRGLKFSATTNANGNFLLPLPPGNYRLTVSCKGFQVWQYQHVPVHALSVTSLEVRLNIGAATESVTVEAVEVTAMSDTAEVSRVVNGRQGTGKAKEEIFTPRLRDYFPETLYWAPSLITNRNGTAKLNFKLADNITTWKMSVLASTVDGHVGTTDLEIQAFQPFFVALDPPKVLTVGDEIDLPVTVRNYLPKAQNVQIEMKPADWFKLLESGKQNITVPTADSTNAVFPFLTLLPVKGGKQQVLAANRTTGDAIEKPVTVHPDGKDESRTASALLSASEPIALDLPSGMMPNSVHAELKVYPNLFAHVGESIEASLMRPYGCGEQTISSTYPSVILLKYYKEAKLPASEISERARKYLDLGYRRLLNYQAPGGGFTYWGHGDADVALSAYAVRFLTDASSVTSVDQDVIARAQQFLLSAQSAEGAWKPQYGDSQGTTAYVARVLAASTTNVTDSAMKAKLADAVKKALRNLDDPRRAMLEPYTMALYALAAADAGAKDEATAMLSRLKKVAHKEGNTTYWALETNTAFYGWGRAGRVEATAMVLQALSQIDGQSPSTRDQIASGLLFLLKEKDRYGVWYSGQGTINVLLAMMGILADSPNSAEAVSTTVTVNGKPAGAMKLSNSANAGPVYLDISQYLAPGANQVVLNRGNDRTYASVQVVANYYVRWSQNSDVRELTRLGESRALRLAVKFDKTATNIGDKIRCSVHAERIGHYGYGMLLAEIGLPPGADVDRSSLDEAIETSHWSLSRYDVLPDRLILYLWPQAGGTKVDFSFRPRFGLKALSAQSMMYDYYNPDEQVTLAPVAFQVAQQRKTPREAVRGRLGGV